MTQAHTNQAHTNRAAPDTWDALAFEGIDALPSPALVFHAERIAFNIDRMIAIAGAAERLVPHVKTVKCPDVVRMMLDRGIARFKCATIAEADMLAQLGAPEVVIAYQLVGPNLDRLTRLRDRSAQTEFSAITDALDAVHKLATHATPERPLPVLIDIDPGLGRTGVPPAKAEEIAHAIHAAPGLRFEGLHAYDGHIRSPDPLERQALVEEAFAPVQELIRSLNKQSLSPSRVIAGGTGSFPIHAQNSEFLLSPGTAVLSDWRTAIEFPDLGLTHAAFMLTRVVSTSRAGGITLDLGHKSVASENPKERRALFIGPNHRGPAEAEVLVHSEEHLAILSDWTGSYKVGDHLFALPYHVCPTVALHDEAVIIERGTIHDRWPITARSRRLSI